jgi:chromosome segregation ATPase
LIEAAMYVALGFCIAGLLAIAIMPSIWRRAVRLTRRAVEATSPMTHAETRAEIGALRAAHAVEYRRLEAGVERLQRSAAENRIARDRAEHVASDLRKEFGAREQALSEAMAREDTLRREMADHEEALARARARIRELERTVQRLVSAAEETARPSEAPSVAGEGISDQSPDTAQIEAAREAERTAHRSAVSGLETEIEALKRQLERAQRSADRAADTGEQPRGSEDLARMRKGMRDRDDRLFAAESKLVAAQAEIARLSILAEQQAEHDGEAGDGGSAAGVLDRTRRLETDNTRLRAELYGNDDMRALRDQLAELAAGVVAAIGTDEDLSTLAETPSPAEATSAQDANAFLPRDAVAGPEVEVEIEEAAKAGETGDVASAVPETPEKPQERAARGDGTQETGERTQSLAARIRAARGRMKADANARSQQPQAPILPGPAQPSRRSSASEK